MTEAIAELINPARRVAIIDVRPNADPNGVLPSLKEGKLAVPWSKLFNKNVCMRPLWTEVAQHKAWPESDCDDSTF